MTLKPRFLGSSFLKKHTQTAFESEQSDFHLRIGQNQRAVVKIQFICLVFTAFDSEKSDFYLRIELNQRAVVKLYFQKNHNHKSFTFMVFLMS